MQTADQETSLRQKAAEVFGSVEDATVWFQQPAIGLNRQRPIDLIGTDEGRELVSTYLDQIEFGVYV
ncbi:MbcA/ParS/Xre antitoxin family protein [Allosphingosinicella vermicomposti]|uniref:MbcA/ParS/Xre antitoxin family protein n=1 Tax=Allosphingosinicella vermicomposti TaxID=614671 RepID=UPI000D0F51BD|nr:MbcA/ParS/Xre antitoxin family protein [Allosphingosinicella vermicomposti]